MPWPMVYLDTTWLWVISHHFKVYHNLSISIEYLIINEPLMTMMSCNHVQQLAMMGEHVCLDWCKYKTHWGSTTTTTTTTTIRAPGDEGTSWCIPWRRRSSPEVHRPPHRSPPWPGTSGGWRSGAWPGPPSLGWARRCPESSPKSQTPAICTEGQDVRIVVHFKAHLHRFERLAMIFLSPLQ